VIERKTGGDGIGERKQKEETSGSNLKRPGKKHKVEKSTKESLKTIRSPSLLDPEKKEKSGQGPSDANKAKRVKGKKQGAKGKVVRKTA